MVAKQVYLLFFRLGEVIILDSYKTNVAFRNGYAWEEEKMADERDIQDEDGGLERELYKLGKKIEQAYRDYQVLQDMYRYYTGKEHEWLK